ncbi:glycine receptor subunit alpha-4 isoform X2 [Eurytemora carolleeae]|uniref:glycine receptor subunit alpha-4 isoform X2 n=1 Tax=Eurytemora carolleeae TaxID=1294199 RepID=UPI000C756ED6|nr:glycine receptor subunit alpha-4 isoform X2 [Eurytemora carolleeae]|eukprot:XP_023341297.1 glycine receptor subunit alpha-4-like isoform X2 [Eurytemora affinis]
MMMLEGGHGFKTSYLCLLLLIIICKIGCEVDAPAGQVFVHGKDDPLELNDILPRHNKIYDKMRPPKREGNATKVFFHVTVMSLDTIDESSMTYTCDIFFAQSWKDFRLRLPDNMTSEYRLLPVEWLTEIWRPDSFFKNAKSVTFQTMTIPNHYIWLYQDKSILYMVKLTLVLSCAMNFKNYPHDEQICNLKIESISHTTDDLVFEWDPIMPLDVDSGIELPQLELTHNFTGDCTTAYSTGNFTCLEVVFMFKRRLGYYLFHTYLPTCLIVIMSWISFWIKPEAVPARVTLGVTSLLTLSTQHANSQKSLPPVSYIKAIDVFMSGCTVFVFLSLMEYALVNVVMGDIADIEKKKSVGISSILMNSRSPGLHLTPPINQEKILADLMQEQDRKEQEADNGMGFYSEMKLEGSMESDTNGSHCLHRSVQLGPHRSIYNSKLKDELLEKGHPQISKHSPFLPPPPPPPHYIKNQYPTIIKANPQDAHAKRQKEIRDLMKKRREKAVLVDRISRWLFPTSFILLNIVYWALFGDHDLW